MSFDIYNKKPKLVEPKILRYYDEKIKIKQNKERIKQNDLIKQQEESNIIPTPWYKKICLNSWEFIKDNYGFFIIISLIITLLYVRYVEVNNRKKKIKNIIDKINKEKEINQFIELQKINKQLEQYQ